MGGLKVVWHLKDRKLHEKLDEATDCDFSRQLINAVESKSMKANFTIGESKFTFHVREDDIEDVPVFDPMNWNGYPTVIPPKNVWMRVECERIDTILGIRIKVVKIRRCAKFVELKGRDEWVGTDGEPLDGEYVKRFRLWEG